MPSFARDPADLCSADYHNTQLPRDPADLCSADSEAPTFGVPKPASLRGVVRGRGVSDAEGPEAGAGVRVGRGGGRVAEVVMKSRDFAGSSLFGGREPVPRSQGAGGGGGGTEARVLALHMGMDPRMLHIGTPNRPCITLLYKALKRACMVRAVMGSVLLSD